MKERRKDQRYQTHVGVVFQMGASSGENRGVVTNLSQHGAFVTTVDPAMEGEFVVMHLADNLRGSSFRIRSQVVRKSYDGMAVRFVHSTQTAKQIEAMLPA